MELIVSNGLLCLLDGFGVRNLHPIMTTATAAFAAFRSMTTEESATSTFYLVYNRTSDVILLSVSMHRKVFGLLLVAEAAKADVATVANERLAAAFR